MNTGQTNELSSKKIPIFIAKKGPPRVRVRVRVRVFMKCIYFFSDVESVTLPFREIKLSPYLNL